MKPRYAFIVGLIIVGALFLAREVAVAGFHPPTGIGQALPSQTPTFKANDTSNIGIQTVTGLGGVDLSHLLLNDNSPPAKSWLISTNDTNSYWSMGYDQVGTGCAKLQITLTTTPQALNDKCLMTTEIIQIAGGYGFTASQRIAFDDGSCATVGAVTQGGGPTQDVATGRYYMPVSLTSITNATTPKDPVIGGVHILLDGQSNGNCTTTDGVNGPSGGGKATVYSYAYAQSPVPTTAGHNVDLNYDRSCAPGSCVPWVHAYSFNLTVVGLDNSTNTKTYYYTMTPDSGNMAANFRAPNTLANAGLAFVGGCNLVSGTRLCNKTTPGHTDTLQNFADNMLNGSSTGGYNSGGTGDMKLLVSTGTQFGNPSVACCSPIYVYNFQNWGWAEARQLTVAQANPEPAVSVLPENVRDMLVMEEAARATGPLLQADYAVAYPAVYPHQEMALYGLDMNAGGSIRTRWEATAMNGTDGTCNTGGTNATHTSDMATVGFGGGVSLVNHYSVSALVSPTFAITPGTCHARDAYDKVGYPVTFDANGSIVTTEGNQQSIGFDLAAGTSTGARFDHIYCAIQGQCWLDASSGQSGIHAIAYVVDNITVDFSCQNSVQPRASEGVIMNYYDFDEQFCPDEIFHPDYVQLADPDNGLNDIYLNNLAFCGACTTYSQGHFGGKITTIGEEYWNEILVMFGATSFKKPGVDSLSGNQPWQISGITTVKDAPPLSHRLPNAGMPQNGVAVKNNPPDGTTITMQVTRDCLGPSYFQNCAVSSTGPDHGCNSFFLSGCTVDDAIRNAVVTITFHTNAGDSSCDAGGALSQSTNPLTICIGSTKVITAQNWSTAFGYTTNYYRSRCDMNNQTPMGAAARVCGIPMKPTLTGFTAVLADPYTQGFGTTGGMTTNDPTDITVVAPGWENITSDAQGGAFGGSNAETEDLSLHGWRTDVTNHVVPSQSPCSTSSTPVVLWCGNVSTGRGILIQKFAVWNDMFDTNNNQFGYFDSMAAVLAKWDSTVGTFVHNAFGGDGSRTESHIGINTCGWFTLDSCPGTNASARFEAMDQNAMLAGSLYDECMLAKNGVIPKPSGPLDFSGTGVGDSASALTFAGLWGSLPDGTTFSYGPCQPFQVHTGRVPYYD